MLSTLLIGCGNRDNAAKNSESDNQNTVASTTASAATNAAKEPVTLNFVNYILTKEGETNFRNLTDKFNGMQSDIKVELDMVPWSNYLDKLMTSVAAGMAPDASLNKSQWFLPFQAQNAIAPIDEYFNNWKYKDEVDSNLMAQYKKVAGDDKLYFMPETLLTIFFYYRKDLFAKANLQTPTTWDEFLEVAKKLTVDTDGDGKIDQYGYTMRANAVGENNWYSFIFKDMKNPGFYDENGKPSFTSPEVIAGNQFFIDLFQKYHVTPPTSPMDGTNENIAYFSAGKAAMLMNHLQTSVKLKTAVGDNLGMFPIPLGKNGTRFSGGGENCYTIYNSSKNKDAAWTFISWLTEPEQHKTFIESGETMAFMASVKDQYQSDPIQKISMDLIKDQKWEPLTPNMGNYANKLWPDLIAKALLGKIDSATMMQQLQDELYGKQ
jgi:ABC-type sugar transport system, periplasmic component